MLLYDLFSAFTIIGNYDTSPCKQVLTKQGYIGISK